MAEALYLPPCQTQKHNAVQFRFSRYAIYGNILIAHYNGKTEAALPPFTTLDIQRLSQFAELDNTSVLNQFLHSLNTLIHNNQHIGDIILNYNGRQYSSTIIPEIVEKPVAPTTKIPKKAVQTLEQAAAKMQSAAAYLQQKIRPQPSFYATPEKPRPNCCTLKPKHPKYKTYSPPTRTKPTHSSCPTATPCTFAH